MKPLAALLNPGEQVTHALPRGRKGWLRVVRGAVEMNGHDLGIGDGAAPGDEPNLTMRAKTDTEILAFDLP